MSWIFGSSYAQNHNDHQLRLAGMPALIFSLFIRSSDFPNLESDHKHKQLLADADNAHKLRVAGTPTSLVFLEVFQPAQFRGRECDQGANRSNPANEKEIAGTPTFYPIYNYLLNTVIGGIGGKGGKSLKIGGDGGFGQGTQLTMEEAMLYRRVTGGIGGEGGESDRRGGNGGVGGRPMFERPLVPNSRNSPLPKNRSRADACCRVA
ncbi:hypothetical protein C8J57DRAFT_1527267 [Mycena rebaudengoi]|nr:hypothetical protein C8J57DRAFT_1527267 [Mycena rebaudengoi]